MKYKDMKQVVALFEKEWNLSKKRIWSNKQYLCLDLFDGSTRTNRTICIL